MKQEYAILIQSMILYAIYIVPATIISIIIGNGVIDLEFFQRTLIIIILFKIIQVEVTLNYKK